nr:hypothetical protein Iba_chr01bCG10510 [Ipomoea batatas]GMC51639.1 hypothetical protein Iba_chr01cCG8120 [Ipomoea batatas]GMC53342.1 hypothetical protein Iba_chr01dCG5690 [Ipomoea batatas]
MVKLFPTRFLCISCPLVQEGKLPDNSLYDKSLFCRFGLFCAGNGPINLLLPRNKFLSELRMKSSFGIRPVKWLKLKSLKTSSDVLQY